MVMRRVLLFEFKHPVPPGTLVRSFHEFNRDNRQWGKRRKVIKKNELLMIVSSFRNERRAWQYWVMTSDGHKQEFWSGNLYMKIPRNRTW